MKGIRNNELIITGIKTIVQLLNNNFIYDEIVEMLGAAKGTVFNYIRRFKLRKIYE